VAQQDLRGTSRDWWVYIPAQAAAGKPLSVMVFQDGGGPKNSIPTIFDNMIAKGEIPPMVGIFLNPGSFDDKRSNRSVEYDTLSDKYARFLLEEILPEVGKMATLTTDPNERAIFGVSSGGICAFTVAWERPEAFRKVASGVGSFVNLQGGATGIGGGHNYPISSAKVSGTTRQIPRSPSASTSATAPTIWTTPTATGPWRISTWRSRSPGPATITSSCTAMDSTAGATAST
jgi:enterochelin esterase-like enzyme